MFESERKFPIKKKRYRLKISREEMKEKLEEINKEQPSPEPISKEEPSMKPYNFIIYTDGGFNQRSRIGSWSYLIKVRYNKKRFKLYKGNGIMQFNANTPILTELKAVVEAIRFIASNKNKERYKYTINSICVYSDSKQVVYSRDIYKKYVENDWYFMNSDLSVTEELKEVWVEINKLNEIHNIKYKWIKGHNGNKNNEYVDKVCTSRIKERLHQERILRYNNRIINNEK
jgi:ribonuclease HI